MDAIQMIKERRSIRKYTDDVVPQEILEKIVDAARFSPSWTNAQIARFTFVSDKNLIAKIAEDGVKGFVYNKKTLENAKNILILSFVKGKSGVLPPERGDIKIENATKWEMFDAGIACQTFCLAAHEQGVGTCIFGVIDETEIAKTIDLPADETVAALIVIGYPAEAGKEPVRKEVAELTRFK